MKMKELKAKNYSLNMACVVPAHLCKRLGKKAREEKKSRSKVLREILADYFSYECHQFKKRGRKIYLYRKDKEQEK